MGCEGTRAPRYPLKHMLIIVRLWSSQLIVSQERSLASSRAPAVEAAMVLHVVLSDIRRKKRTAPLGRFPPVPFNIKDMGHREFSKVTCKKSCELKLWT